MEEADVNKLQTENFNLKNDLFIAEKTIDILKQQLSEMNQKVIGLENNLSHHARVLKKYKEDRKKLADAIDKAVESQKNF